MTLSFAAFLTHAKVTGWIVSQSVQIHKRETKDSRSFMTNLYEFQSSCITLFFCSANISIHLKASTLFRSGLCVSCQCVSQAFRHLASHLHSGDIARCVLLLPLSRTLANVRKLRWFYEALLFQFYMNDSQWMPVDYWRRILLRPQKSLIVKGSGVGCVAPFFLVWIESFPNLSNTFALNLFYWSKFNLSQVAITTSWAPLHELVKFQNPRD